MKNYLITAGIALGVVLLVLAFVPRSIINQVNPVVGSVSSPDIQSPYFSFGGVRQWAGKSDSLIQATTTVCAIQAPAASSTLMLASLHLSVSSTTASTITIAKSATPYATTTIFGSQMAVAANATATIIASTTPVAAAGGVTQFNGGEYVVFGMQGGIGSFSPSGTCQAVFVQTSY